jgi:protein tyrosine/serine phosphatase
MATPNDGRSTFDRLLNFRDVGQYVNHITGNQLLRPGLLYRSARPDDATPTDRQRLLDDFKFKTIIDLRTPTEHIEQAKKYAAATPAPSTPVAAPKDPLAPVKIAGIKYEDVNVNGSGYSNALIKQLSYFHAAKLFVLYAAGWRKDAIAVLATNVMADRGLDGLAIDSLIHSKGEIKRIFDVLSNPEAYPVLVHCTQGKDRTGLTVLLVMMLLGVPQEAVERDYRLSESELEPEREEKVKEIKSIGLPDSFADCPKEWTGVVCRFINEEMGGVERYLESCGVTREQQRELKKLLLLDPYCA